MNKITCGKCARKKKYTLDQRMELAKQLQEGNNECNCGRVLVVRDGLFRWSESKLNLKEVSVI